MTLGEKLKVLRRREGLSQAELAARLGVSPSAVGMYDQDRGRPTAERLSQLCQLLFVSADYFLGKAYGPLHELDDILSRLHDELRGADTLMFCGETLDEGDIEEITQAIRFGARLAFERRREKRKDDNRK